MSSSNKPPPSITDPEQVAALLHALRHEIVQPIHTLGLLLDLVPGGGDAKRLAAWSESGNRALDSLKRMLRMLADTAKLDLAPPPAVRQTVRLQALFGALAAGKRELAALAGVELRVLQSARTVESDAELLRLGLDALLDNALRHAGGAVLLGVKSHGPKLLIGIWDCGSGLDAEDTANYLQDFVRGPPSSKTNEARANLGTGLGLGLGLARRAASLLGAEFYLNSVRGRGTVAGLLLEQEGSAQKRVLE